MTDHPQEAERSAGGGEKGNHATLAARRRKMHREETIEKLRAIGLLQKVIDDAEKLADQTYDLDAVMVQRIKAANDVRLKLIAKYLPDVKAVEMTGEDGGAINLLARVERVIVRPDNTNG